MISKGGSSPFFATVSIFFSKVNLIFLSSYLFLLPPSLVRSEAAKTLDTMGVCLSIRNVSYLFISPTYLFRGLSSASSDVAENDITSPPKLL